MLEAVYSLIVVASIIGIAVIYYRAGYRDALKKKKEGK